MSGWLQYGLYNDSSSLGCFCEYSIEYLFHQTPSHRHYTFTYEYTVTTIDLHYRIYREDNVPQKAPNEIQQGYRCSVELWPSQDEIAKFSLETTIDENGRGDLSFTGIGSGEFTAHIVLRFESQLLSRGENRISIPVLVWHSVPLYSSEY